MYQYLSLLSDVVRNGVRVPNRTGIDTISVFGRQLWFPLYQGFPLVTTKKVFWRGVVAELLWFLSGDTNSRTLSNEGVTIWDEWATETGELGPIYGEQWRSWPDKNNGNIDQMRKLIEGIKTRPYSRRHIVTAWNPADLPDETVSPQDNVMHGRMCLAPCHCLFQFYVAGGRLSCQLYQRSADVFLGVPFNIASYALLTHMVAQQCDLEVGNFVHTFGDAHLYVNHLTDDIVYEQLRRTPKPLPKLVLRKAPSLFEYTYNDIALSGYDPCASIAAPIAV